MFRSATRQSAKHTADSAVPATVPGRVGSGRASPQRRLGPPPGSPASAPKCVAPPADRGRSAGGAVETELTSAPKPRVAAGSPIPDRTADGAGSAEHTSTAEPRAAAGSSTSERNANAAGAAERTTTATPRVASGRSIPAAVKREVWRRDQGCCTYVDRHTGRRCGSRFFLEMDHIVPVAVGGGAEPGNLALRCAAHHRYRHSRPGQRSAARDSVT